MNHTPHHHFANFFAQEELKPYAFGVSRKLGQGSICLDLKTDLKETFEAYVDKESKTKMEDFMVNLEDYSDLVGKDGDFQKPFIFDNDKLYITRYFNYETKILQGIRSLIESGKTERDERFRQLEKSAIFQKLGNEQEVNEGADWQLVATALAYVNNFSIITGGPGTGKTTTVAKVLSVLLESNPQIEVKLAAPSGKAAMRMKEALEGTKFIPTEFKEKINDLKPYTIHRLLGPVYQSPYFKHNSENPVLADVIIVDEASMIDVALFSKLISAIGKDTRLILLGDQNQLASVEAGSLLGDLCSSVSKMNHFSSELKTQMEAIVPGLNLPEVEETGLLQDHIAQLKYSWRFDDNPEFRVVSEAVIQNEQEKIKAWFEEGGLKGKIQIDPDYKDKLFEKFIKSYEEYIPKESQVTDESIAASIEKFNSFRILAVIRNGKHGVSGLNSRVEKYLADKGLINLQSEFYEHRPVMVTRNHPDLGLFNGDAGVVRRDPANKDKLKIFFLTKEQQADKDPETNNETIQKSLVKGYSPALLTDVETVFAMTVHKSQGSEFKKVLMVMPKAKELPLLTRELLYTGITRAKEELLVQGTEEVILAAAKGKVKRASGITHRI